MRTTLLFICATLLVLIYWLGVQNRQLQQQLNLAADYRSQLQRRTDDSVQMQQMYTEQISQLNRQLASSAYQLSNLSNELQETRLAADSEYEALLEQMQGQVALLPGQQTAAPDNTVFSAFSEPANAAALANERMPRLYDSYLNTLGIPGTERQLVMRALIDFASQRYQLLPDLLAGSLAADQALAFFGAHALAANMGMILTRPQQDALRQYEQSLKQDTLRAVYHEALLQSGSAITKPEQGKVLQAILGEIVSAENNWAALVASDGSMISAHREKLAALGRAREHLSAQLNPEQIAQLERFIDDQSSSVDVILEVSTDSSGLVSITQARLGVEDLPQ